MATASPSPAGASLNQFLAPNAGPLATQTGYPGGMTQSQWQAAFTNSAVGGGDPYAPPTSTPAPAGTPIPQQVAAAAPGVQMVPGFGPIMSNYIDQFNKSIGASRAAINTHLQQALGELGQRRDAAAQVVAGLPNEIAANTAIGQKALAQASGSGAGAMDPGAAAQAAVQPGQLQQFLGSAVGGAAAATPYLKLANMANYQGGEALLNNQAMIGQDELSDQQRQFMTQMDMNQLQNQESQQAAAAQDARYRADLQYQQELTSRANAQAVADQQATQVGLSGGSAQLDQIKSSPAYQYALHAMQTGLYQPESIGAGNLTGNALQPLNPLGPFGIGTPNNNPKSVQVKQTPQQIIDKYKTANPDVLRALAAEGFLPQDKVAAALGVGAAATKP